MLSFNDFLTEQKSKSATQLKKGDVVLDGPEDDPNEVLSKAVQDGTGYWVQVKNLRTNKKDKIYIDSGDKIKMNI